MCIYIIQCNTLITNYFVGSYMRVCIYPLGGSVVCDSFETICQVSIKRKDMLLYFMAHKTVTNVTIKCSFSITSQSTVCEKVTKYDVNTWRARRAQAH